MSSGTKTIYLCGAGGKGNIGAEAITLSIIKLFQRRYRHVRFLVSAWYPERMRELLSRLDGDFVFIKQESVLENPLTIAQADVFIICGDVSISETVVSFLPIYYAIRTLSANLLRKKVIFLGIEAEKIKRQSNLWALKYLVDRPSNVLVLRNEESLSNMGQIPIRRAQLLLGCEPTLSLNQDDLMGFDYVNDQISTSKLRVGFGIRDHFTQPFKVNPLRRKMSRRDTPGTGNNSDMQRIIEFTAWIADYVAERYDAQIIFIPHHYLPEDERVIRPDSEIAQIIIDRLRVAKDVVVVEDCLHAFTVVNLYRKLDLVFSMRHHTNSFAYLNHVPTFGYAIYEKIRAFFTHIGHEAMLLDPFTTELSKVQAKIDTVVQHREEIAKELKESLGVLQGCLDASLENVMYEEQRDTSKSLIDSTI